MSEQNEYPVLVALGGNLPSIAGSPARTLAAALKSLISLGVTVEAVSRFYETPCFPAGAGPDYVNAAARLRSSEGPEQLLQILHEVEHQFGRERMNRWGMRSLDLDLIAFGDRVLPDLAGYKDWLDLSHEAQRREAPDRLILPHPRLQDRAFVLVPLSDVAGSWRHPVLGLTVQEMLERLPDSEKSGVKPLDLPETS